MIAEKKDILQQYAELNPGLISRICIETGELATFVDAKSAAFASGVYGDLVNSSVKKGVIVDRKWIFARKKVVNTFKY